MDFLGASGKAGLAPMAGVTDSAFREICRGFGAGFTMSEMVSAEGMFHRRSKSRDLIVFTPAERPFGIQLFGKDAEKLARATVAVTELNPDFIDLNCGCPARKVVKSGSGGALMNDLPGLELIMKAMRKASNLPLTIKIRSGFNGGAISAVRVGKMAEDCGFNAISIHPRTVVQGFKGKADWSLISEVKKALKIPVIGNGDIKNVKDARLMLKSTGCDLIMIGRAVLGKPWSFAEINGNKESISSEILLETIKKHFCLSVERKGEYVGVREMRKHLIWYSREFADAGEFRRKVVVMEEPAVILDEIERFFQPRHSFVPTQEHGNEKAN
jgi:tRNA-dihydrouridine synthase B